MTVHHLGLIIVTLGGALVTWESTITMKRSNVPFRIFSNFSVKRSNQIIKGPVLVWFTCYDIKKIKSARLMIRYSCMDILGCFQVYGPRSMKRKCEGSYIIPFQTVYVWPFICILFAGSTTFFLFLFWSSAPPKWAVLNWWNSPSLRMPSILFWH